MPDKRTKILITIFFAFGALVQIITSLTWIHLSTDKIGAGSVTIGEAYFMCGQAIGQLMWILSVRLFIVRKFLIGELVFEYMFSLLLIDIISILFLNPYEVELSKTMAFLLATLGYLYRLRIYIKK